MAELRKGAQVLRDTGAFATAQVGGQLLQALSGLIVARLLGPLAYGTWRLLNLILQYSGSLHLGLLNSLHRDVPICRGEGDEEREERLVRGTFTAMLLFSLAGGAGYLAASCWPGWGADLRLGLAVLGGVLVFQILYSFFQVWLRSHHRFLRLSRVHLTVAALTAVSHLALAWLWGLSGLFVSFLLTSFVALVLIQRAAGLQPRLFWDRALIGTQVRTGFPILLVGLAYDLLISVDNLLVASFLGREALGLYALGPMAARLVEMIPAALAVVVYPWLGRLYGESGRDPSRLSTYIRIPTVLLAHLVPLVAGLFYLVLPPLVRLFLPEFAGGIAAGRILLLGVCFRGLLGVAAGLLTVIGRQNRYLLLQVVALAFSATLISLALSKGRGIEGAATAAAIGCLVYSLLILPYASAQLRPPGKHGPDWRFLLRVYLPVLISLAALLLLERPLAGLFDGRGWAEPWPEAATALVAAAAYLLLHLALFAWARREVAWLLEILGLGGGRRLGGEGGEVEEQ